MKEYKKYFQKEIERFYPDNSKHISREIDLAFLSISQDISFAKNSRNPIDKRLEIAGYFLATVKVLDKEGESYDRIRELLIEIAKEYVRTKNRSQSFLKRLPAKLVNTQFATLLLRQFDKRTSTRAHPEGFVARIITEKKETLGFGYGI